MTETQTRKIFFWLLAIIFLATAPLVVFYAMGYRFSFDRGIFIYTGSITLKSTPKEISVFIDNKPVSKGVINFLNYSYHIDGLKPGKHSLKVQAPGFKDWFKNIHIHSGISTEFWNIFLIKNRYEETKYLSDSVDNFFISPDNRKFALVENTKNGAIVKIIDVKKKKVSYAFPFDGFFFSKTEKENIEWSPKEGRLIVPLIKNNKKEYFVISIGNKEIINLNELIGEKEIRWLRWSSKEKNAIFYMHKNNLLKLDLSTSNKKVLVKNIFGYDFSGSYFYYLSKQNGIIYRKSVKGNNRTEQISTKTIKVAGGNEFKIIVYDKDRVAIISQNGELYLYNNDDGDRSLEKISTGVLGLHFSDDGKKMVYWNEKEIFVYFLRKWETQPVRRKGEIVDIARFLKNINNVEWFRDYEHIIFTVDNKIMMAEIDRRSHRNIYDIFNTGNPDTKVVYSGINDNLFFINKDNLFCSISLKIK